MFQTGVMACDASEIGLIELPTLHGRKRSAFSSMQGGQKAFRELKAQVDHELYTEPKNVPQLTQEKVSEANGGIQR